MKNLPLGLAWFIITIVSTKNYSSFTDPHSSISKTSCYLSITFWVCLNPFSLHYVFFVSIDTPTCPSGLSYSRNSVCGPKHRTKTEDPRYRIFKEWETLWQYVYSTRSLICISRPTTSPNSITDTSCHRPRMIHGLLRDNDGNTISWLDPRRTGNVILVYR